MRVRAVGIVLAAAPWVLVACGDEGDVKGAAACPDIAKSDAFAIGRDAGAQVDYDAVMEAIDCDGVVSEREERCLSSPFARAPDATHFASQVGDSPEDAVRLAAGEGTTIESVLSRTRNAARIAVQLDGDPGVYDVQRVRGGWLVVGGEGCASGAVRSGLDGEGSGDEISEECQQAIDEATPDEDGEAVVFCAG